MVTRVNILSNQFSYAPQIPPNIGAKARMRAHLDLLIKFLVTGGDPLPIESLTITNKVARVVTQEKNFNSLPGAKLSISGTGVPEIDDRQEVQQVFTDGFSFNIDLPDGVFTNGLTYSFSSTGWLLLDSTLDSLLLRSGSNTSFFKILIKIGKQLTDQNEIVHWCVVPDNVNYLNEIQVLYPNILQTLYFAPIHNSNSNENYFNTYCLYGDEGILHFFGGSSWDLLLSKTNDALTLCTIGEIKSYSKESTLILFGRKGTNLLYYEFTNGHEAYFSASPFTVNGFNYYSINHGSYTNFISGLYLNKLTASNYRINTAFQYSIPGYFYSGYKAKNANPSNAKNIFKSIIITDENFYDIGKVPGIYFLDFHISAISEETSTMQSYRKTINNKVRNTVIFYTNSGAQGRLDTYVNRTRSYLLLDLTGPIR